MAAIQASASDQVVTITYADLISHAAAHQMTCKKLANYRCIEHFRVSRTQLPLEFIYLTNLYFYAQQNDLPACCGEIFKHPPTEKELTDDLNHSFEAATIAHELTIVEGGTMSDLIQFIALMEMMPSEWQSYDRQAPQTQQAKNA